ncbi:hypothetical protein M426DRAFT_25831 [Hypoxylon sp. CI-4A]|nr:hypothetical protein M426DRAFT_25831 [Hypoxylon sp. CI-4A]
MERSILAIFAILAVQSTLAGNPAWEPKLSFHGTVGELASPNLIASITGNTTTIPNEHGLGDWVGIATGTGNADVQLWPEKTIRYCYEDDNTRSILNNDLMAAAQKWIDAGLDEDRFKYVEVSRTECTDNRPNVLLVKYSMPGPGPGQSSMFTTPAKIPANGNLHGPTMTLTDDENMGMLDKVANYAHELGHAWGLVHEHQNPYFWESALGGESGSTFGSHNFNCRNLKDYDRVQQDITNRINNDPNGLGESQYGRHRQAVCKIRSVAGLYRFSAYDYLPMRVSETQQGATTEDQIDWTSLMIYPSGAGGRPDGNPGAPDTRAYILMKPDGTPIAPVLNPNANDVEGIKTMYSVGADPDDGPLLFEPRYKFNNAFKRNAVTSV